MLESHLPACLNPTQRIGVSPVLGLVAIERGLGVPCNDILTVETEKQIETESYFIDKRRFAGVASGRERRLHQRAAVGPCQPRPRQSSRSPRPFRAFIETRKTHERCARVAKRTQAGSFQVPKALLGTPHGLDFRAHQGFRAHLQLRGSMQHWEQLPRPLGGPQNLTPQMVPHTTIG